MRVRLDGIEEELPDGISIARLIERRGENPLHLLVELNGRHVRREAFAETFIREGDEVDLIQAAFGG